jgi:hypothetical protein
LSSVDDDDDNDDDGCSDTILIIIELSKENKENDDAGSQVTLHTMGTYDSIDFLTPGGLSLFSVACCRVVGGRREEESACSINSGVENAPVGSQCHEEGQLNIVSSGRLLYHIGFYE